MGKIRKAKIGNKIMSVKAYLEKHFYGRIIVSIKIGDKIYSIPKKFKIE